MHITLMVLSSLEVPFPSRQSGKEPRDGLGQSPLSHASTIRRGRTAEARARSRSIPTSAPFLWRWSPARRWNSTKLREASLCTCWQALEDSAFLLTIAWRDTDW